MCARTQTCFRQTTIFSSRQMRSCFCAHPLKPAAAAAPSLRAALNRGPRPRHTSCRPYCYDFPTPRAHLIMICTCCLPVVPFAHWQMPPVTRESSTGVTRQDSLPPTESQEAAEAFENMALSEEEEDLQCIYVKADGEQCLRAPNSDTNYCWQHARMMFGAVRPFPRTRPQPFCYYRSSSFAYVSCACF